MSKMEPLTVEEQEMAEQYFYLVDKFLKREHLDPNEYYDVVIFGYLLFKGSAAIRTRPKKRTFTD